jgi:4-amino-4-deoxy-L-arabinose transferase-like glycosyltransferase
LTRTELATENPSSSLSSNSPKPSTFPYRDLLILLALATCLFFVALGRLPLMEPDEGRNAEVAREMLVSGDWITPHFNSLAYMDKPAVYFWLVAASFRVAGVSEYAARMPSALMALGTLILTWLMARKMFGREAGLRAGIV